MVSKRASKRPPKDVQFNKHFRRPKNIPLTDAKIEALVKKIESQGRVGRPLTSAKTDEGNWLDDRIKNWETSQKPAEPSETWDDNMMGWSESEAEDDVTEVNPGCYDGEGEIETEAEGCGECAEDVAEEESEEKGDDDSNDVADPLEFHGNEDSETVESIGKPSIDDEDQLSDPGEGGLGEQLSEDDKHNVENNADSGLNKAREIKRDQEYPGAGDNESPPIIIMKWPTELTNFVEAQQQLATHGIYFFDWLSNHETEPDVHLKVFGQAFHVHSSVLKHYSMYFKQFLDSRDKEGLINKNDTFPYRWVSLVEENDEWYLVMDHPDPDMKPVSKSNPPDASLQIEYFGNLIDIFYGKEVVFRSSRELRVLAEMADFYDTLPIARLATSIAMSDSPQLMQDLGESIQNEPLQWLDIGNKLDQKKLRRESAIYMVGDWQNPLPKATSDTTKLLKKLRDELIIKIERVWKMVRLNSTGSSPVDRVFTPRAIDHLFVFAECPLPKLFRELYAIHKYETQITGYLLQEILEMLDNQLQFNQRGLQAGVGECEERFFCIEVEAASF